MNLTTDFKRKGNIFLEGIIIVIVLFVGALFIIISNMALKEVNTDYQADTSINASAKAILQNTTTSYPTWFDSGFVFFFVGLWLASLIFAFFIDTSPLFLVIVLLLLCFIIIIGAYLSNTFEEVSQDDDLISSTNDFPMIQYIMGHIVAFVIAIASTLTICLYAKSRIQ